MLELLLASLGALLNLTTLAANQPRVAQRGLTTLLSANTSLYSAIMDLVRTWDKRAGERGWRTIASCLPWAALVSPALVCFTCQ
jgi:hypothetical protein